LNRLRFGALGVVALMGIAFFAACGGGDDKTIDTGDGKVTISDDLPDEFPDDFPVYDGADLQGSYQGESEGVSGTVATWTTGDSADDVTNFYKDKLNGDNWKIQSSGTSGGGSFFVVLNKDESKAGYVVIGEADGDTSIIVTVGDNDGSVSGDDSGDNASGDDVEDTSGEDNAGDDGSSDEGSTDAQLPEEQDLSDDFPSDRVPLPDDSRVTSSSSISSGGQNSFFVEFYSKKSADELRDYFGDTLTGKGWTEALASEADGDVYLSYTNSETSATASVTVIITDADVEGYQTVTLSVVQ